MIFSERKVFEILNFDWIKWKSLLILLNIKSVENHLFQKHSNGRQWICKFQVWRISLFDSHCDTRRLCQEEDWSWLCSQSKHLLPRILTQMRLTCPAPAPHSGRLNTTISSSIMKYCEINNDIAKPSNSLKARAFLNWKPRQKIFEIKRCICVFIPFVLLWFWFHIFIFLRLMSSNLSKTLTTFSCLCSDSQVETYYLWEFESLNGISKIGWRNENIVQDFLCWRLFQITFFKPYFMQNKFNFPNNLLNWCWRSVLFAFQFHKIKICFSKGNSVNNSYSFEIWKIREEKCFYKVLLPVKFLVEFIQ